MVCACSIGMGFRSTPEQFSQHDDSLSSIEAAALLSTTTPHACISRCVFAVATWDRSSQRHNGDGGTPTHQGASAVRNYCRRAGNSSTHWRQCRSLPRCGARWHHSRSTRAPAHQCAHDFSRSASLTRTLNRLASGTLITASLAARRGAKTPH